MTISPSDIYISQCNPKVGDISGNLAHVLREYNKACASGAELAVFPEMCITGYPAEDLLHFPHFVREALEANDALAQATEGKDTALIVGNIYQQDVLFNAAYFFAAGGTQVRCKSNLPNDGVFDEHRYFEPAPLQPLVHWKGHNIALLICADIWNMDVSHATCKQGADMAIVINGSPFEVEKDAKRKALAHELCSHFDVSLLYVNMVGGQDELVFDGGSFFMDESGNTTHQAVFLDEYHGVLPKGEQASDKFALCYHAMVIGLRDYVLKSGFSKVLIGLSGGIDSALTAIVAADALGAENVQCVMLPSPFTAQISLDDAQALAENLGVQYDILPIKDGMDAIDSMLEGQQVSDLALENIQSRLRGLTLMALSNSSNALLITTGNKSEMAVGYATLYGDMCGAYNPLKDAYKTDVFAISRWRNAHVPHYAKVAKDELMPERIITRPPSAELRADQKDEDSLPPYDVLDAILYDIIENRMDALSLIEAGHDEDTVRRITRLLKIAEYKRRQAPIGVKLYPTSFGKDWRLPLANRFGG